MLKPTVYEVRGYMLEIGCPNSEIEAEKFFDYFDSVGWMVGAKKPMKNWQAACRNWKRGVKDTPLPKKTYNEMPTRTYSNAPKVEECAPPPSDWKQLLQDLANKKAVR